MAPVCKATARSALKSDFHSLNQWLRMSIKTESDERDRKSASKSINGALMLSVTLLVDWDKVANFPHVCDNAFDPEHHDIKHVLMHVSELMEEADCASLTLLGTDIDPQNIDVGLDLPILIEQTPSAVRALRSAVVRELEILFYEQQPPLALIFRKSGDNVSFRCEPIFDRSEAPARAEEMKRTDAIEMLTELLRVFIRAARLLCPEMTRDCAVFDEWLEEAGVDLTT
jgi:hypothetical protein